MTQHAYSQMPNYGTQGSDYSSLLNFGLNENIMNPGGSPQANPPANFQGGAFDFSFGNAQNSPSVTPPNDTGMGFSDIMSGFNALTGGIQAYTGIKQLGLAEDSFKFNKGVTETNLANQAQSVNTQLEDRQRSRIANNPGAYQSLSTYMDSNRVSGKVGG